MKKTSLNKRQLSSLNEKSLDQVKESFNIWRKTRSKRGRIPEGLWQSALKLYPHFSAYRICKNLRLGYKEFKARLPKSAPAFLPTLPTKTPTSSSPFIEVSLSSSTSDLNINLEYSKVDGSCLKLSLSGNIRMNDVENLCKKILEA